MSSFPGRPRVLKGALVTADLFDPLSTSIVFQYNPAEMRRSLIPRAPTDPESDRSEAMRISGAPIETIDMNIELDAVDEAASGDVTATEVGIYPKLSALELLVYPNLMRVMTNTALMAIGMIEVVPPRSPLTVLVWGPGRVLPVRVNSYQIVEEAYDPRLNPVRATVAISLHVLSYDDLSPINRGYGLYLANQAFKQVMALYGRDPHQSASRYSGGL